MLVTVICLMVDSLLANMVIIFMLIYHSLFFGQKAFTMKPKKCVNNRKASLLSLLHLMEVISVNKHIFKYVCQLLEKWVNKYLDFFFIFFLIFLLFFFFRYFLLSLLPRTSQLKIHISIYIIINVFSVKFLP